MDLELEFKLNVNFVKVTTELVINSSTLNDVFAFNFDSVFFNSDAEAVVNIDNG